MKNLEKETKQPKQNGGPIHITDKNFYDALEKNHAVLIDFFAESCEPCKTIAPKIEEISEKYAGTVLIGKLDIAKNPEVADSFGVNSIPTLLLLKDGKEIDRIIGSLSKIEIEKAIRRVFILRPQRGNRLQKPKRKKRCHSEEYYDANGLYYCCPICSKTIRYLSHPSMGEAWSRGRVRGEHLRSHGIDQRYISSSRKDDPLLIRELFQWNQKKTEKIGGRSVTSKKHKIVNMNYPPENMPTEEIERFWGKPRKEDKKLLGNAKVKEKHRNEPSPV